MGVAMKLYIVADMEGIAGVVSEEELGEYKHGNSEDYQKARIQFTNEVLAVCEAALESGVEEIIVNDFHGNGRNLLLEKFPPEVLIIRGGFRKTAGYDLLDSSYLGLVILGAHAKSNTFDSVLAHTYTNKVEFELFGEPLGEFDLLALIAGEKKVPTILISGDNKAVEQACKTLPSTLSVVTKWSIGRNSAMCLHPSQVCTLLKEETKRAIKKAREIEPPEIMPPVQLCIKPLDFRVVDHISWIPGLKKIGENKFEYIAQNMIQVAEIIYGVTLLSSL